MKTCASCQETKPLTAFYRKADNRDGKQNVCAPCYNLRYRPQLFDAQKYYVYEHVRTDTDAVFYVGKGCGSRAAKVEDRANPRHQRVVNKLLRGGFAVEVRIVSSGLSEIAAFALERDRISFWRSSGASLCNLTEGGDGFAGLSRSDAHREHISVALEGRKLSPEHVEKMRAALTGRKQPSEAVERRRASNMLRSRTKEQKQRMRDAHTVEQLRSRALTVIAIGEAKQRPETGFYKRCIGCGRAYDTSCFTKRAASEDGLHVYCRGCKNSRSRAQRAKYNKFGIDYSGSGIEIQRRGVDGKPLTGVMKKCATCNEVIDAVHFARRAVSTDGLQFHCRKCQAVKYAAREH